MDFVQLLPWAVGSGIVCLVLAIAGIGRRAKPVGLDRLNALCDPFAGSADAPAQSLRGRFLEAVGGAMDKVWRQRDGVSQSKIRARLSAAGFGAALGPQLFLAASLACATAGFLLAGGAGVAFHAQITQGMLIALGGAAAGFMAPSLVLAWMGKRRQERIFFTLPAALDLLTICVEVGHGLDGALSRVVTEIEEMAPDLAHELNLYSLHLQMGRRRRDALHDLGLRAGVDDLNALATVLIQADRFGASIANSLRDLSDSLRVKRRHLAEERAQKTAVKLIFPLVLFIFPGIFVALVGPAAILVIRDLQL